MENRDSIAGYLFVTFTGESEEGEQIYFSLSQDGLHWHDLNGGKPVLISDVGEKGVRDPFILRSQDGSKYYLIATDLRIASGISWEDAVLHGSRSIIVWESEDLLCWSGPKSCRIGTEESRCVWAPEVIYSHEKDEYMVFWSAFSEGKHKVYRAYTRDFQTFTNKGLYMEQAYDVIDMTIIRSEDTYYRFYKNEQDKCICMDYGTDLEGEFIRINASCLEELRGVEGPAVFPMKNSGWCLLVDQFAVNGGYIPLICNSLSEGNFKFVEEDQYDMGQLQKRHGSVLLLSDNEYRAIKERYGKAE